VDAQTHFVKDITGVLEANAWRWVGKRPTLRLRPRVNQGLLYSIEFAVPEVEMKDTGPVTMQFYVGDHLLDTVTYKDPGQKKFEKAIPPEWMTPDNDVFLSAEIDKMWTSPDNGAHLGFILTSLGLGVAGAQ